MKLIVPTGAPAGCDGNHTLPELPGHRAFPGLASPITDQCDARHTFIACPGNNLGSWRFL